ncbi:MAG: hypothetical protein RLY35_682 [Bacteroidota bacterium]|jgi:methionine aminotransferase
MAFPVDKLPHVGTTIFSVMSQLAVEYKAINLGQGFPTFPVDPVLIDLVTKAMKDGHNQYAPMPGVPALRQRITEKMASRQSVHYDWQSEVTITAGASQALFTAIGSLIQEGDEVVLFGPAYDCYAPAIVLNGGIVKWVNLTYPNFKLDPEELRQSISSKTKLIILNNPHNPSGKVWSKEELDGIADVVLENNLFLIADEVYEHIVFDGARHISMAEYPALRNQLLLTFSFGKTLHATGWKLGYAVGPADWMSSFRKQHQFNVFTCNSAFQHAIAQYMENGKIYDAISPMYQHKRDLLLKEMNHPLFEVLPCAGTYFQLMKFNGDSMRSDVDLAKEWAISQGAALIPTSVFYEDMQDNRVFRVCFAKEDEELIAAAHQLNQLH